MGGKKGGIGSDPHQTPRRLDAAPRASLPPRDRSEVQRPHPDRPPGQPRPPPQGHRGRPGHHPAHRPALARAPTSTVASTASARARPLARPATSPRTWPTNSNAGSSKGRPSRGWTAPTGPRKGWPITCSRPRASGPPAAPCSASARGSASASTAPLTTTSAATPTSKPRPEQTSPS